MANSNAPRSHARARQLLERRPDILVHPRNALADDSETAAVPHHCYRPGELLVTNEAGQVDAFERVAGQLHLGYRRREDHGRPKLSGKGSELAGPGPPPPAFTSTAMNPWKTSCVGWKTTLTASSRRRRTTSCSACPFGGWIPMATPVPPERAKK